MPLYSVDTVFSYHERTKHHVDRPARSAGYLDWANQPDPFRRFAGAPLHALPLKGLPASPPYDRLFAPGSIAPAPVCLETVSAFLLYALGLAAWKVIPGDRWALRCNPSSGNLHPTEGYVLLGPEAGVAAETGVHHYAPREHGLEQRAVLPGDGWRRLMAGFPAGSFLTGLSAVHWREAWKYGERAYRYCCHDAGHALAALSFSAAALGWRVCVLEGVPDGDTARLLGLDREADFAKAERETAELLAVVVPADHGAAVAARLDEGALDAALRDAAWSGRANRLSAEHVDWAVIGEAAEAAVSPGVAAAAPYAPVPRGASSGTERPHLATALFRQRRSAVAMDGETHLDREAFLGMLSRTMPTARPPWWSLDAGRVDIQLVLFLHRVQGLAPGLYVLLRDPAAEKELRGAMHAAFAWEPVDGQLPLYRLVEGDLREAAGQLSCGQDIASDGAFAVAMVARFAGVIESAGAHAYPRLFREAGMVGQVLYLEAEAAGVRGTGIGCYFDDAVHRALGLADNAWQSLYHFTVGGPVEDRRLATWPPYDDDRVNGPA